MRVDENLSQDRTEENDVLFKTCEGIATRFSGTGCIILLMTESGFSLGSCGVSDENAADVLRSVADCIETVQSPSGYVN